VHVCVCVRMEFSKVSLSTRTELEGRNAPKSCSQVKGTTRCTRCSLRVPSMVLVLLLVLLLLVLLLLLDVVVKAAAAPAAPALTEEGRRDTGSGIGGGGGRCLVCVGWCERVRRTGCSKHVYTSQLQKHVRVHVSMSNPDTYVPRKMEGPLLATPGAAAATGKGGGGDCCRGASSKRPGGRGQQQGAAAGGAAAAAAACHPPPVVVCVVVDGEARRPS
jgi:hypothetical protein